MFKQLWMVDLDNITEQNNKTELNSILNNIMIQENEK